MQADEPGPGAGAIARAAREAYRELLERDEHGETRMAPDATETILATIATWGVPILRMGEEEACRTWTWSDLHLRDRASVRIHGRPFWSWRTHDLALTRRWRQRVSPADTVIHLGDFATEAVHEDAAGRC